MGTNRTAQRYAKALLELALTRKKEAAIAQEMQQIVSTLDQSAALQKTLSAPVFSLQLKTKLLSEVFGNCTEEVQQLLKLLTANNRLPLLKAVASGFLAQYEIHQGRSTAYVTTAVPLNATLEAKILEKAKTLTSNSLTLVNKIDPAILGGFVLQVGDLQYNASVANEIKALRSAITTNHTL